MKAGGPLAPVLEVRGLTVDFPAGRVLDDVSFALHRDQTLAIVGESGSGKSMTALSIMRLLPRGAVLSGGSVTLRGGAGTGDEPVRVLDLAPGRMRALRGSRVAMIFQEPMTALNPVLSIGEQMIETVRLHTPHRGAESADVAIKAMERTGIREAASRMRSYPHELSGGMRQRVMIAMALVGNPSVLLADEPTTALDAMIQSQILDLISDAREERGLGVVLITHDIGLVRQRSEAVCVMYRGRVVEFGPTASVLGAPLHPYTRSLLACAPSIPRRSGGLPTVADVIGEASRPDPALEGRSAWWPGHAAPSPGATAGLWKPSDGRWVAVWGEEGKRGSDQSSSEVPSIEPLASGMRGG
jgi:ABC-type dipeptide/oligopeptide/nickel transport system ATPase component